MNQPEKLTQARLKELLHYDPETGEFTWRVAKGRKVHVGDRAGSLNDATGYWCIGVDYKIYRAHRLAWLYVHGCFPDGDLDHKNRIKTDCRIANLRLTTESKNGANRKLSVASTSGFKGVSWHKNTKKYLARIGFRGKIANLGSYNTAREAALVYDYVARRTFKEFARTNRDLGLLGTAADPR